MTNTAKRLDHIPEDKLPPKFRNRLLKLNEMMDRVGVLDEDSQEVYVNEGGFRALLREYLPTEYEEQYLRRLRDLDSTKLVDVAEGSTPRGRRMSLIPWEEVMKHPATFPGLPTSPTLNESSTPDEIRRAIQQLAPNVPEEIFEPTILSRRLQVLSGAAPTQGGGPGASEPVRLAEGVAPSVVDCCVANLGFWTVVLIAGVMIVASIALAAAIVVVGPVAAGVGAAGAIVITAGGAAVSAAFWAVFWGWFFSLVGFAVAGSVLTVIIACLIDPSFRR